MKRSREGKVGRRGSLPLHLSFPPLFPIPSNLQPTTAERKRQLLAEAHVPLEASSSAFIDPNAAENAPEESTAEGEDNVDGDD